MCERRHCAYLLTTTGNVYFIIAICFKVLCQKLIKICANSDLSTLEDVTQEFSVEAYRQPVLTEKAMYPLPYRYGIVDSISTEVDEVLKREESRYYRAMADSDDEEEGQIS